MKPKVVVLFALGISSLVSCKTEKQEGRNEVPPEIRTRESAMEMPPTTASSPADLVPPIEASVAFAESDAAEEALDEAGSVPPRAIPVGEDAELEDELAFEVALEESPPLEVIAPEILESKDFNVFYVELSRFGAWFLTDDFGYVWQPGVAVTENDWRPYMRGRWVDSEEGWVWVSDEPFGWATYHYGRWALLEKHGWVWIPGKDWAPAWVSWRKTDDHIGWAPLPPETSYAEEFHYDSGVDVDYGVDPSWYNFVPVTSFHEPVFQHCVPRTRLVTIWGGSINITVIRSERGRIHCHGPDRDWVHRRTGRRPEVCRLNRHDRPVHFEDHRRARLRGHDYEVFAPQVGARWNPAVRPPVVRDQWGRTQVNRGGRKMSDEAARRFVTNYTRRQKDARDVVKTREAREAWDRQRRVHERISAERERQQAEERARVAKGRQIETERQREAERRATAARERQQTEERARVVRGRKIEPERPQQAMEEQRREAEQRAAAERERQQVEERARVVRGRKVESERPQQAMEEQRREAEQRAAAERERQQTEERARVVRGRKVESERQQQAMEEQRREAEQRAAAERERQQTEERARVVRGRKVESERQQQAMEEQRREAEQRAAAERERQQVEERARVVRGRKVESERQEQAMEEQRREAEQRAAAERERQQVEERARVVRGRKVESERQQREMEAKRREAQERAAAERDRQLADARARAMKEQQIESERQRRAMEEQRRAAAQHAAAERDRQQAQARARAMEEQRRAAERQQAEARARAMEEQRRAAERQQAEERARVVRGRKIEAEQRQRQIEEQRRDAEQRAAAERERQQAEKRSRVVRGRRVE